MPIQNINSLNNPSSFSLDENVENYIIQSLANLGQRYGIQGDSIRIQSSSFISLFDSNSTYDKNTHIGRVQYTVNNGIPQVNIDIVELSDTEGIRSIETVHTEPNTNYEISNITFSINIPETNVIACHNAFLYCDEHYFVMSAILDTSLKTNDIYICEKYDKYTNELISGLRIYDTNKEAIYLSKNAEDDARIYYDCSIFNCNLNDEIYIVEDDDPTINVHFSIEDIGSSKFITTHGITNENDDVIQSEYTFTPESVLTNIYKGLAENNEVSELFTNKTAAELPNKHISTAELKEYGVSLYIEKDNYFFSSTPSAITITGTEYANDFVGYLTKINNFIYDKPYIYESMKKYFSDSHYKITNNSNVFIYQVIKELFNNIYDYTKLQTTLFIPLDYVFEYAYNSNEPSQIYFSTHDIAVRYATKTDNIVEQVKSLNNTAALICLSTEVEKIVFYNYSIKYDPENNENIYSIEVNKHIELPYINEYGYWVVDGIETELYARGKDAGNPNIVIIETNYDEDTPKITSSANKEYFLSVPWIKKNAIIQLPNTFRKRGATVTEEHTTINEHDYVNCKFWVPNVSSAPVNRQEEYIEAFKYAIIFNVAELSLIDEYTDNENYLKTIYGETGKVSSIWTFNESSNEFEYVNYKRDNVEYAIDLNYVSNVNSLIGWSLNNYIPQDPDNFMFSYLVFDNANMITKNQPVSTTRVYPTIANHLGGEYNSNYANQFNIGIRFLDTIDSLMYSDIQQNGQNTGSYAYSISGISQSSARYFDSWVNVNDETAKVSSSPYEDNEEYVPSHMNNSVPILDLSEVFVRDNTVLNRTNIMSLDASGNTYYAYFGTRYDSPTKSNVVIGTSESNINIGTKTLTESVGHNVFNKHSEININFDNTRISSYAYICNDAIFEKDTISYGINWNKTQVGNVTYWNTSVRPTGNYSNTDMVLAFERNSVSAIYEMIPVSTLNEMFVKCDIYDKLYASSEPLKMHICDGINLSYLITKVVMPQECSTIEDFNSKVSSITSHNNIISYAVPGMSSYIAMLISDKENINNELNITYYINNSKIYIDIEENRQFNTLSLAQKLKTQYAPGTSAIAYNGIIYYANPQNPNDGRVLDTKTENGTTYYAYIAPDSIEVNGVTYYKTQQSKPEGNYIEQTITRYETTYHAWVFVTSITVNGITYSYYSTVPEDPNDGTVLVTETRNGTTYYAYVAPNTIEVDGITYHKTRQEQPEGNYIEQTTTEYDITYYAWVLVTSIIVDGITYYSTQPDNPNDGRVLDTKTENGTTYYAYIAPDTIEVDDITYYKTRQEQPAGNYVEQTTTAYNITYYAWVLITSIIVYGITYSSTQPENPNDGRVLATETRNGTIYYAYVAPDTIEVEGIIYYKTRQEQPGDNYIEQTTTAYDITYYAWVLNEPGE